MNVWNNNGWASFKATWNGYLWEHGECSQDGHMIGTMKGCMLGLCKNTEWEGVWWGHIGDALQEHDQ